MSEAKQIQAIYDSKYTIAELEASINVYSQLHKRFKTDCDNGYVGSFDDWLQIYGGSGGSGGEGDGMSTWAIYHDALADGSMPEVPQEGESIEFRGWYKGTTVKTVWMSMKTSKKFNEGSWGAPVKICGEDGIATIIRGHVPTMSDLPTTVRDGDGYIVDADGHLYVWQAAAGAWKDCGLVRGEAGDSAYVHIKYSNDGKTFTANNGEVPGVYIGMYTDANKEDSLVFSDYTWNRIKGASVTQIIEQYALNNDKTTLPNESDWKDFVLTPGPYNRYLWNREITYIDGTPSEPTAACIIGMYSEDGRGIVSITEYYLVSTKSTGVTIDDAGWTKEVQTVSTAFPYLWNYEVIEYSDGTITKTSPQLVGNKSEDGEDAVDVKIFTSNGTFNIEKGGTNTLTCEVWRGSVNITSTLLDAAFKWLRSSADTQGDIIWNSRHDIDKYKHPTLVIDDDDVVRKAVFFCEVDLDKIKI